MPLPADSTGESFTWLPLPLHAGCLCAALMAQRGYTVDVFEQRRMPRQTDARSHRSYPMVLSSRSAQGFKEAGLQLPLPEPQAAVFMPNGKLEMLWEDSE